MKLLRCAALSAVLIVTLAGCASSPSQTGNFAVTLTVTGTVKQVHLDTFWNPGSTTPHPDDLDVTVKLPFTVTYTGLQRSIVSLLACDTTHNLSGKLHLTIAEQGQQPITNDGYDPCPSPLTVTADVN